MQKYCEYIYLEYESGLYLENKKKKKGMKISMDINSRDIKRYVYLKLGKREEDEITEEDLNKITFLNLNYTNFKGEINEYDFNDLKYFKNLKELTLNGFEISDEMIENINSISSLEILVINHCSFSTNKELINNIKTLVLTYTKINDLKNFQMCGTLESVKLISCEDVDIKRLSPLNKLKEISIHNSNILNVTELKNFDVLEILNIDGSKVDSDDLESILNNDIKFSHEDEFYLIG